MKPGTPTGPMQVITQSVVSVVPSTKTEAWFSATSVTSGFTSTVAPMTAPRHRKKRSIRVTFVSVTTQLTVRLLMSF